MPSRRILSNSNLAPVQEAAVNPYDSFNSDVINKLTRIVSGGKDIDVVVDGLDVSSNDRNPWLSTDNILTTFTSKNDFLIKGWLPSADDEVYIGQYVPGDSTTYIDLCIPHQRSYGYSYIECKLPVDKLVYYFGKNKDKDFEVSFKLKMGTPKSIVASINSTKAVLDHPEPREEAYTLRLSRNFIRDRKEDGLLFRIGAVLDGADPSEDLVKESNNKTYIRIYDIQVKIYGYTREPFPRAIGPVNGVYGLAGIHPIKKLKVTPGLAIKDDAMLEELGLTKYDRETVVELDPTQDSSWIKGGKYTVANFFDGKDPTAQTQYVFQLNNTNNGYIRRNGTFTSDGHLQVKIGSVNFSPIDDLEVVSNDTKITFSSFTEDEDNNVIFHYTGKATISNGSNICLLCYNKDGTTTFNKDKTVVCEIKNKLTFTNGKLDDFDIELKSDKLTGRIQSVNNFFGYITNGPIKVSGDPQLYNTELVKWAYVVVYYSYFKNPVPNASYIGLVREEDLNDVKFREDYLILAKVRFIDPYTIDIISYENRQRKWLPRSDKINYSTTCNYPDIWYEDVPDTVTDAIDYIAKFDVNLARLIRYKHDYDAEISSAFNLVTNHELDISGKSKKPFVSINEYSHLERRIRVNTNLLVVDTVYPYGNPDLASKTFTWDSTRKIYYNSTLKWAITFDAQVIDDAQEYEFFHLGGEVLVRATMGPYDTTTNTITNRYICFNTIGPFKFIDKDTGSDTVKMDWQYEDMLLYPTAPSMNKTSGKYNDTDDGGWTTGYYGGTHNSTGNYLLSYTTADGATVSSLNNDKNHFHFIKFRNELLTNDRFLKLLDMLPRDPEVLFEKRVIEGQKSSNTNDQVHIQSSQHQLDDDMVDYNLTMSVRDTVKPTAVDINGTTKTAATFTNHIKSSKFTIAGANNANSVAPVKCTDVNDPSYRTFNKNLKDTAVLTSVDITPSGGKDRIEIKSTDVHLMPDGDNKILVSNTNSSTNLYDIKSSQYTVGDFFKYWFKPKFSYDSASSKLRIIIDGAKNYLTRISDIISEFNRQARSTTVSISKVESTQDTIKYTYSHTSQNTPIEDGMLVYTEGSSTSPTYCNTIDADNEYFAKITQSSASVNIYGFGYQNKNEDYSNSEQYLYIEPQKMGQLCLAVDTQSGSISWADSGHTKIKIRLASVQPADCIDGFECKPGMGVYTKFATGNIYRYNKYVIDSIENSSGYTYLIVGIDSNYSGGSALPTVNSSNNRIYFICDDNHNGLYPNLTVTGIYQIGDNSIKFSTDYRYTKYTDYISVGDRIFLDSSSSITAFNSIINIPEDSPLTLSEIDYVEGTDIESFSTTKSYSVNDIVEYNGIYYRFNVAKSSGAWDDSKVSNIDLSWYIKGITISDYVFDDVIFSEGSDYNQNDIVIYDGSFYKFNSDKSAGAWDSSKVSELPFEFNAKAYIKEEIEGVYEDYKKRLLQYPIMSITKKDGSDSIFVVKIAKISTETNAANRKISADFCNSSSISFSFDLLDSNYNNENDGLIYSTSEYSVDNLFTISKSNIIDITPSSDPNNENYEIYRNQAGGSPTYINYATFEIEWPQPIDTDMLINIGNVYYALLYKLTYQEHENFSSVNFNYKYQINKVNNGTYVLTASSTEKTNVLSKVNDSIVYTDDLGSPKQYSNEISEVNPQIAIVDPNDTSHFSVSKSNGYNTTPASGSLTATARNITLKDIVSANTSDSQARINADILIDITNIKDAEYPETTRDTFTILEKYFKSKFVIINDLIDRIDSSSGLPTKPYISLTFSIIDNDELVKDVAYSENPTKIIWKDEYRGYNNTKEEEEDFSKMVMYPVQVLTNAVGGTGLVDIVKEHNASGGDIDKLAGYGSYRGPIFDIKAGIRCEFDFQYLNTKSKIKTEGGRVYITTKNSSGTEVDVPLDEIDLDTGVKLTDRMSLKDIPDTIFAKASMYYINNTSSGSDLNFIQIGYDPKGGNLNGKTSIQYKTIDNPTSSTKYPNIVTSLIPPSKRKLDGWYYENTKITLGTTTLRKTTSHNVYAKWLYDSLNVTFIDTNTGTGKYSNQTRSMTFINTTTNNWNTLSNLVYNNVISGMPDWTRAGYALKWAYDSNGNNEALETDSYNNNGYKPYVTETTNPATLKIYATWVSVSLTVTASPNNGTWYENANGWTPTTLDSNNKTKGYDYNQSYGILPKVSRIGYKFDGWKNITTGTNTFISESDSVGTINHTIQAQWTPEVYVIKWISQGGSAVADWIGRQYNTQLGTLPAPTRTGYSLSGWYTAASGGTKISNTTLVTGNAVYVV